MVIRTHCLETGELAENELPVPGINDVNTTVELGAGTIRGVVVFLHGLGNPGLPYPITDTTGGFFPSFLLTFANLLNTDGWHFIAPPYVSDTVADADYSNRIALDIRTDPEKGGRYLRNVLHWWDHVRAYAGLKWDFDMPLVPFGGSWGGLQTLKIAAARPDTIAAYGAHVPATIVTQINGFDEFLSLPSSVGLDVDLNSLNNLTMPGVVGGQASDPLLGDDNAQALANNAISAGAPVTYRASTGAHSFPSADATFYANWFASAVDPLCPRLF